MVPQHKQKIEKLSQLSKGQLTSSMSMNVQNSDNAGASFDSTVLANKTLTQHARFNSMHLKVNVDFYNDE